MTVNTCQQCLWFRKCKVKRLYLQLITVWNQMFIKNNSTNNTNHNIHLSDRESNKRGRRENIVLLYHLSFKNQNIWIVKIFFSDKCCLDLLFPSNRKNKFTVLKVSEIAIDFVLYPLLATWLKSLPFFESSALCSKPR